MLSRLAALAAVLAAGLCCVAPAAAQASGPGGDLSDEQFDELYCVYDRMLELSDDLYFVVIESGLSRDVDLENSDEALDVVVEFVTDCADTYMWDDDQVSIATSVGIAALIAEELEAAMVDAGMTEKDFDSLIDMADMLTDAEIAKFLTGDWRDDGMLQAKVVNALKAAGVPNNAALLSDALEYIEAGIVGMFQLEMWAAKETQ